MSCVWLKLVISLFLVVTALREPTSSSKALLCHSGRTVSHTHSLPLFNGDGIWNYGGNTGSSSFFQCYGSMNHSLDFSVINIPKADFINYGLVYGDVVALKNRFGGMSVGIIGKSHALDGNVILSDNLAANIMLERSKFLSIYPIKNMVGLSSVRLVPFKDSLVDYQGTDLFSSHIRPFFVGRFRPLVEGDILAIKGRKHDSNSTTETCVIDFKVVAVVQKPASTPFAKNAMGNRFANTHGVVVDETIVDVPNDEWLDRSQDHRRSVVSMSQLGGMSSIAPSFLKLAKLSLYWQSMFRKAGSSRPRGILLHGPPGSGKSSLVKAMAFESGAYLHTIRETDLIDRDSTANLKKAFDLAKRNGPSVLLIEALDQVCGRRDSSSTQQNSPNPASDRKLTAYLGQLMDELSNDDDVLIVGTCARPNSVDSSLRKFNRFDNEIGIPSLDEAARYEILRIKTAGMPLSRDVDLRRIARDTHGYVASDIAQLCTNSALEAILELQRVKDDKMDQRLPGEYFGHDGHLIVESNHFEVALKKSHPASLRENIVQVPDIGWKDVGGLLDVKQELIEAIQFPVEYPDKFDKFGLKPSKGVLFYGPPGCGKTLLAKAVANECGVNFISVKGPELLTMWFGESEANIRDLFDKARAAAPCILFFDELDSIAKSRGSGMFSGNDASDRVINQILIELDGIDDRKSVFVIGATNRPELLDPAITRPGRLDRLVYIPLPDLESRIQIFQANLRRTPLDSDVSMEYMANVTNGYSGADIAEICRQATRLAIRDSIDNDHQKSLEPDTFANNTSSSHIDKVTRRHFDSAIAMSRKSVSEVDLQRFDEFRKDFGQGTSSG